MSLCLAALVGSESFEIFNLLHQNGSNVFANIRLLNFDPITSFFFPVNQSSFSYPSLLWLLTNFF